MILAELRRNPQQNPKTNVIDLMNRFKNEDDVYVTFTELNKIGINPRSEYRTPVGIYAYRVKDVWNNFTSQRLANASRLDANMSFLVPFAGDQKHVNFFRVKGQNLLFGENYKLSDFQNDINKLRTFVDNDLIDDALKMMRAEGTRRTKTYFGKIWYVTYRIAMTLGDRAWREKMNKGEDPRQNEIAFAWMPLLRKLGYDGVVDPGEGVIYSGEPEQAVFFTTKIMTHLVTVENRIDNPKNYIYRAAEGIAKKWFKSPDFDRILRDQVEFFKEKQIDDSQKFLFRQVVEEHLLDIFLDDHADEFFKIHAEALTKFSDDVKRGYQNAFVKLSIGAKINSEIDARVADNARQQE